MAQHPIKQLAAQTAETASELAEYLDTLRGFNHPGASWPRDLTTDENAGLLPLLRGAVGALGACVDGIAAQTGFDGTPAGHLNEAGRLIVHAVLKIREAETALGTSSTQPQPPRLAAQDFPAVPHPAQPGNAPASAGPRRTSPRPRTTQTP